MKIIAVGLNYERHLSEFKADKPAEPVIFMKPDSALLKNNKPFFLPHFSEEIHYETEIVVRICKLGKNIAEKFASRYYSEVGLGIDFTARDLQTRARQLGQPWEISKGFDGSAVISDFLPLAGFGDIQHIGFHLDINGNTVQTGNTQDMIFSVNEIIAYVSRFFTLKTGDLIFTGTPAGVGPVKRNDKLEGYLEDKLMFRFNVK